MRLAFTPYRLNKLLTNGSDGGLFVIDGKEAFSARDLMEFYRSCCCNGLKLSQRCSFCKGYAKFNNLPPKMIFRLLDAKENIWSYSYEGRLTSLPIMASIYKDTGKKCNKKEPGVPFVLKYKSRLFIRPPLELRDENDMPNLEFRVVEIFDDDDDDDDAGSHSSAVDIILPPSPSSSVVSVEFAAGNNINNNSGSVHIVVKQEARNEVPTPVVVPSLTVEETQQEIEAIFGSITTNALSSNAGVAADNLYDFSPRESDSPHHHHSEFDPFSIFG